MFTRQALATQYSRLLLAKSSSTAQAAAACGTGCHLLPVLLQVAAAQELA
jgi:hypothetical protein